MYLTSIFFAFVIIFNAPTVYALDSCTFLLSQTNRPQSDLRMNSSELAKAGYDPTKIVRNARYSDLEKYKRPGITAFKNEHGSLFLDVKSSVYSTTVPIGVMRVYENSDFKEADELLKRSDLGGNPHEVLTLRIYKINRELGKLETISSGRYLEGAKDSIDGKTVKQELDRFLAEYQLSHQASDIFAVEVIHTHPEFELLFSDGQISLRPVNHVDVVAATDLTERGLIIVTAVVPNGHRYSLALQIDGSTRKNITSDLLGN